MAKEVTFFISNVIDKHSLQDFV